MKSKYGFWKHGFNRLAGLACLAGLVGLTGCKELSCDFSYTPTQPAAGKVVTFSNMSVGADDYYWNFGDNTSSTSTSPTHIFRKPGTYTITLQIVRNKVERRSRTQHITVIDTIPAIACDSDEIYSFTPTKFVAQVYNPWKKTITYQWILPEDAVVSEGQDLDSAAVVCYFTQENVEHTIRLNLQMDGKSVAGIAPYVFTPIHQESMSVLFATATDTMEQFAYKVNKQRIFQTATVCAKKDRGLLRAEQDTLYWYGSYKYTPAYVGELISEVITGFQVDNLAHRIYAYGQDGMWVCDMTGTNKRRLANGKVNAIKVDSVGYCLYWANADSLFVHQLISSQSYHAPFSHDTVSTRYKHITKISINPDLH